eukprot:CAMPEP_0117004694 /NCGR_PEP_ID=MMETSP0472-20121206/5567_1 /TAXON_ID=693140 ORGANISM="Tiarina fusus, Strain LIS" /NCGR_SAMPLE_ID=MMETSP0472 /ASSEMBLY_ACC=CAM_ASM_000603 /LENGTH=222 /DNA_ID=CAMNT_0004705705 /DNA_START=207 /DNA_END=873 /DNA_ORIENTATION=-
MSHPGRSCSCNAPGCSQVKLHEVAFKSTVGSVSALCAFPSVVDFDSLSNSAAKFDFSPGIPPCSAVASSLPVPAFASLRRDTPPLHTRNFPVASTSCTPATFQSQRAPSRSKIPFLTEPEGLRGRLTIAPRVPHEKSLPLHVLPLPQRLLRHLVSFPRAWITEPVLPKSRHGASRIHLREQLRAVVTRMMPHAAWHVALRRLPSHDAEHVGSQDVGARRDGQ